VTGGERNTSTHGWPKSYCKKEGKKSIPRWSDRWPQILLIGLVSFPACLRRPAESRRNNGITSASRLVLLGAGGLYIRYSKKAAYWALRCSFVSLCMLRIRRACSVRRGGPGRMTGWREKGVRCRIWPVKGLRK